MSIINNLNALPNRLEIIFSYLINKGDEGESREYLNRVITLKENKKEGTTMSDEVIKELLTLNLIEEYTQNKTKFLKIKNYSNELKKEIKKQNFFFSKIEPLFLNPNYNDDSGQSNFAKAVSWLLLRSPYEPIDWSNDEIKTFIEKDLSGVDSFDLTNMSRFQNFIYWVKYFGFISFLTLQKDKKYFIPDPTEAIERYLPIIFEDKSELPLNSFISSLSSICPVFEGGSSRVEIEKIAIPNLKRERDTLSKSTSLALLRLKERGKLTLIKKSDGVKVSLDLLKNSDEYTHIEFKREK